MVDLLSVGQFHWSRLRRVMATRRAGWCLSGLLALLALVLAMQGLGWQRLSSSMDVGRLALTNAARTALAAGWLLFLTAAAGVTLSLVLSSPRGRTIRRHLRIASTTSLARWFLAGATLLVLLFVVVVVLPSRFTGHLHFNTTAEELKAQSDVRTALLQALVGGLLAIGAYLTWRQVRVLREGQITDRYTKAVDQLGHVQPNVRVGGIYALERIARDSPADRATIEEVLTAYVRDHATQLIDSPSMRDILGRLLTLQQRSLPYLYWRATSETLRQGRLGPLDALLPNPQSPAVDVQAAITVLGRRLLPPDGRRQLDLTGVVLRYVRLIDGDLKEVVLDKADLQGANLWLADLEGAQLNGSNLQGAELDQTNLRGASLHGANLEGAGTDFPIGASDFRRARLSGANLENVKLSGVDLRGAILHNARFHGAQLQNADVRGADFRTAIGLELAVLSDAAWSIGPNPTMWPDGFDPVKATGWQPGLTNR